jgi:hypothetical protein
VARTLERAWEEKLAAKPQLEEEYHRFVQHKPRILSDAEREAIRRLAMDIPALWAAPTTRAADRKEIIRKARRTRHCRRARQQRACEGAHRVDRWSLHRGSCDSAGGLAERTEYVSADLPADPDVDRGWLGVQRFSVVDKLDFSPSRLTVHSDSPYDKETVHATPFKQRGSLWRFMCSCSCSWSASDSLRECFGVFAGSIYSLPAQKQEQTHSGTTSSQAPHPA